MILEVKNLSKSIGKRKIIDDISFTVNAGEILGFLGPNGSGKTTTIRLITGLIFPDDGSILIEGTDRKLDPVMAMNHVGCVVESPEPYLYLSGWENLKQVAVLRGLEDSEIRRVVARVGLESRIRDKVRKYSLGMKQRLGVATALLGSPKLLILDEPTNGLDPDGMREFREMIRNISKEDGVSVFLSSHLLAEVEQICDRVVFIESGKIMAVETMGEIRGTKLFFVKVPPAEEIGVLLRSLDGVNQVSDLENGYRIGLSSDPAEVLRTLIAGGMPVQTFSEETKDLEERYLEVVKGGIR